MSTGNREGESIRLVHRESGGVSFRANPGGDYRWIAIDTFSVRRHRDDRQLLAALISNPWYAYTYAEPRQPEPIPSLGIHGPYRLDAISAELFVPKSPHEVNSNIRAWAGKYGDLPPNLTAEIAAELARLCSPSNRLYELPDIRETAGHEWGGVIGLDGFIEIVAIEPEDSTLTLLVCGDD